MLPVFPRAITPLPGDRLTLQDCLETNCSRFAQFTIMRTVTTKMNSIKQTKKAFYPVKMGPMLGEWEKGKGRDEEMQEDVLWCTEMERYIHSVTDGTMSYNTDCYIQLEAKVVLTIML